MKCNSLVLHSKTWCLSKCEIVIIVIFIPLQYTQQMLSLTYRVCVFVLSLLMHATVISCVWFKHVCSEILLGFEQSFWMSSFGNDSGSIIKQTWHIYVGRIKAGRICRHLDLNLTVSTICYRRNLFHIFVLNRWR